MVADIIDTTQASIIERHVFDTEVPGKSADFLLHTWLAEGEETIFDWIIFSIVFPVNW
jgi:hypothetical protein